MNSPVMTASFDSGSATGERRERVLCTLTRLEDGRVLRVSILGVRSVGEIVSLEDSNVYFRLWQP